MSWDRTTWALRGYYFFSFAGIGIFLPLFPRWLADRGLPGGTMGWIMGLGPASSVLLPPLLGTVADWLGLRQRMLRFAAWASWLSVWLLLAVVTFVPNRPAFLLPASALLVILRTPTIMLADAIALSRPGNYGRIRLFGSLGFLLSATLGGGLMAGGGATALPWGMILTVIPALALLPLLPTGAQFRPPPVLAQVKHLATQPTYVTFWLTMVFSFAATAGYNVCSTLHWQSFGAGPWEVGVAWGIATSCEVVIMIWADQWIARWGASRVLFLAVLVTVIRHLLMATLPTLGGQLMLQPLHAITFGLFWLAANEINRRSVPPELLGTAQGVFVAGTSLGSALASPVWGAVYEAWGTRTVFSLTAIPAALPLLLFLVRRWRPGPALQRQATPG